MLEINISTENQNSSGYVFGMVEKLKDVESKYNHIDEFVVNVSKDIGEYETAEKFLRRTSCNSSKSMSENV